MFRELCKVSKLEDVTGFGTAVDIKWKSNYGRQYCNKMIIIFLLYYERLGRGSAEFFDDCIKKARMY